MKTKFITINEQPRYRVQLITSGGVLAENLCKNPWHPSEWATYKGDVIRVVDIYDEEYYPDYVIESDGE